MSTFVQVGAGAGDRDARANFRDGFSEFVKALPRDVVRRIVLVEPNPVNIPQLTECWAQYPQAEIYQIGICPPGSDLRELTFYYAEEDGPHFQVFSMKAEHVTKHYPNSQLLEKTVPCMTLHEFLDTHLDGVHLDLLSLDIEGIDAEILLTTDWERVDCARLSFEHLHLGDALDAVVDRLTGSGFSFAGNGVDHNNFDFMFARNATHP